MSNIQKAFANGKAFIPFITCGDPDLETTAKAVRAMAQAGADLIELGIPFSDPTAEGPVIQAANVRALSAGTTTDKIFDLVRELRKDVTIPMVFMTYANVAFSYGSERFISTCKDIGIDGLILPDIPYEEKDEFDPICKRCGVDLISMVAPTSEERIAMVAKEANGFIYVVSSLGVTGVRSEITTDIGAMVKLIRESSDLPCAVGFGISTPEQAKKMAGLSDGAIVGSAIVKLLAQHGREAVPYVADYVKQIRRLPYTLRSSSAILRQIPASMEEASISLGIPPLKSFLRITAVLMFPGVFSGAILSWITVINELSSSVILYSTKTRTLSVAVYTEVVRGSHGTAAALSTILTALTLLSLLIAFRVSGKEEVQI